AGDSGIAILNSGFVNEKNIGGLNEGAIVTITQGNDQEEQGNEEIGKRKAGFTTQFGHRVNLTQKSPFNKGLLLVGYYMRLHHAAHVGSGRGFFFLLDLGHQALGG
ncbi:MAG: hypothetical protein UX82_C0015G0015, partial [Microgenomates group bacterium GW2011_GWE1_47_12]